MTRKAPSAKRSFIMSLTSLILCVAMLLGTTFAWFSETVSSGINTIKSGNLDVELEYYNAEAKKWTTVNGAKEIFNPEAKWEPGYTEVVYLKLSNLGSLAIKYHLGINIVDEVEGTNVEGKTFKLSNFIKFGVVDLTNAEKMEFDSRDKAIAAADPVSAALAAGYTENGNMPENGKDGAEKIVAMVVYMPETVGNEANYKTGTIPPSIHLGINLVATQYTAEVDSFGPDFDENAPWTGAVDTKWYNDTDTEFVINSAEELAGLAKIVNAGTDTFDGKTVKLGKDIDLNNLPWTPIGTSTSQSTKFVGTFNGNGYTISNLYVTGDKGLGLFGYSWVGAHFEGITVKGAYVSGKDYVGVILGSGYLSRNCIKNCVVTDATVIATPYLTDKGVYDGGAKAGAIVGSAYNGSVIGNTAKNCTIMAYRDIGGIAGMMMVDGNFTIDAYDNTVENVNLSYVTVVGVYDDNKTPNQNMGSHVGRYDSKINMGENSGEANLDTTLAFVVANDAELAIVLKQIHKDSKYWDKEIVITALANIYKANHVINQFPEWNGKPGDGNSANNFAGGASGQHYLKLTIIGELDEEAAMPVPTTVFAGNVTVNGFGNSNAGFDTAVNTSVIFQNVAFDASNSADEEKAEDAVAIYVTAAANNVKFDTCTFANATHVTVGGSNPNGVGKIAFDKCTFNNGGCISGGAAKLDITNCVVNGADNGFINMSKATEINVSDSFVTAGKYFLRTSNSGVNLTVKNTEITMYVSEGLKHLVYFRGSSESAKFADCEIAAGYTTYGVDADSTLTIYNDTTENGLTLRTDGITNEVTFYKVEEDSTATTVQVPEGVTSIGGYAFAYNNNVETIVLPSTVTTINDRAFRDTTASTVILNEGITNISYQAFRNASNVKTVVIPSTVTTISKEAFQNSGITTLTIPANVTSIEYGGLRDMKELETVTIEGNVDIPVYAFRACTNLKTVYINGDNVTFGGGSRGMIFTNTENGDGSAITIYVKNEVIKARLMAADTAAKDYGGYNIVVAEQADTNGNYGGENGAPTYAYASNGDELMAHINKAVKPDVVYLSAGEHSIRFSGNYSTDVDGMTIIGSGDVKLSISSSEVTYGRIHLDNVKFENIHFVNDTVGAMGAVTYANCVFDGRLKGSSENKETYAVECTMHNIHTDGDLSSGLITLEKCTLAVAEYAKSSSNGGMKFIDCKIGEMVIWSGNTVVENCDIGKMEAHDGNYTLIVDDKYYAAGSAMLNTAIAAGADTIYLLKSEFKMPSSDVARNITIVGTEGAVIDLTLGAYWEAATLTFENVTFKTGTGMVNGNGSDYAALYSYNTTYNKCVFEGPMRLGRDGAKFVQCSFTKLGNDYVWTYGNDVEFDRCKFYSDGKAILIYSDGGNEVAEVSVKGCEFYATAGAKAGAIANQNCAAIEIHNYGSGVNLVTEGNTIGENFSGEWRIKTYETRLSNTAITVNGTVYTQIAIDGKLMTIDSSKNVTVQ